MILRGEDCIVGIGVEGVRGTAVAPQMWVPARTPSGIAPVIDKVAIKETRGTKVASHASEPVQERAEGDLEFNIRANSIGFILSSLFGKKTSGPKAGQSGVYEHLFEIKPEDPEHQSLTLALSQPLQDYRYRLAVATMLSIDLTPGELVKGVANLIAAEEQEKAGDPYIPAFDDETDPLFRHHDVTIKLAADVAGLAAAQAFAVKSLKTELPNGGRADQNVGELNISNVLATVFDMKGSFELDLENTDLHDAFIDNDYFALEISMSRSDITIGTTSHPTLAITFPRISIANWKPNRPIDDVVREQIDFMVHYDADEAEAVNLLLTNTRADYDADNES